MRRIFLKILEVILFIITLPLGLIFLLINSDGPIMWLDDAITGTLNIVAWVIRAEKPYPTYTFTAVVGGLEDDDEGNDTGPDPEPDPPNPAGPAGGDLTELQIDRLYRLFPGLTRELEKV